MIGVFAAIGNVLLTWTVMAEALTLRGDTQAGTRSGLDRLMIRPDSCWFCDGENFSSFCLERVVGDYPDLFPYHNDIYQSAVCGAEVYALIYSATGFRARSAGIINDEPNFRASGFNNVVSSIKVLQRPQGAVAAIRNNGSYQGRPYIKSFAFVPVGAYDLGDLRELGLGEDRPIDAVEVPKGGSVELRSQGDSIALQSQFRGHIFGARRTLGAGLHDLNEITFQKNGACNGLTDSAGNCLTTFQKVTVPWARQTHGMIVKE